MYQPDIKYCVAMEGPHGAVNRFFSDFEEATKYREVCLNTLNLMWGLIDAHVGAEQTRLHEQTAVQLYPVAFG